jgi:hypothetical protein
MPTIQSSVSVPANGSIESLISGSQFEFAPYNASVEIALVGAAAGLVADVSTGQDLVAEAYLISSANRFPIMPDDFLIQDVVRQGERIKMRVRNTTAAAIVVWFNVRIFPVAR